MSFEEMERLARIFVERYGVRGIRLTGGEPTVRAHLPVLVREDLARSLQGAVFVRPTVPPLEARHVLRLPPALRREHARFRLEKADRTPA